MTQGPRAFQVGLAQIVEGRNMLTKTFIKMGGIVMVEKQDFTFPLMKTLTVALTPHSSRMSGIGWRVGKIGSCGGSCLEVALI